MLNLLKINSKGNVAVLIECIQHNTAYVLERKHT